MTSKLDLPYIFLTGTPLAGTRAVARQLGKLTDDAFSVERAPHGPSGGWEMSVPLRPGAPRIAFSLRAKLRTSAVYDPYDDGPSDPRIAAEGAFVRRCDGVLFVADSQFARQEANRGRLSSVNDLVTRSGRTADDVAMVFLLNKRDLPEVMSVEEMSRDLAWPGAAHIPTCGLTGAGVQDALRALLGQLAPG